MIRECGEDRRLERVQPAVVSDLVMIVLPRSAVHANPPHATGEGVVYVAGGLESVSLTQPHMNGHRRQDKVILVRDKRKT